MWSVQYEWESSSGEPGRGTGRGLVVRVTLITEALSPLRAGDVATGMVAFVQRFNSREMVEWDGRFRRGEEDI